MPWKPGQSGNPAGGQGHPVDIRRINKISKSHVEARLSEFLEIPLEELRERGQRTDIPALDALICQIAIKAIVNGDTLRADFLLNRLIGRVKDVEAPKDIEHLDTINLLPREEIVSLLRQRQKRLATSNE
jgi:hypothetical protein